MKKYDYILVGGGLFSAVFAKMQSYMIQTPSPHDFLLKWRGDTLTVTLELESPRKGRAAFRTNIGHARVRRREIIAETDEAVERTEEDFA